MAAYTQAITDFFLRASIVKILSGPLTGIGFNVYIALRERYLNPVLAEGIINGVP